MTSTYSKGGATGAGALSRVLLHFGMLAAGLAFTSWWVSHTILDVSRTRRVADTVLSDSTFRTFVAGEISPMVTTAVPIQSIEQALSTSVAGGATPGSTTVPPTSVPTTATATASGDQLTSRLSTVLGQKAVQQQLADFVVEVHQGLLGQRSAPAVLDRATITQIVSAAVPSLAAGDLAKLHDVSFDPPRIGVLSSGRRLLADKFGLLIAVAAVLLFGSIVLSRNRTAAVTGIGRWLIGISLVHLLVLWVVPVLIVPHVTSSPWAALVSSVARALGAGLITGLVLLFAGGVAIVVGSRFAGNPNDLGVQPAT